MSEGVGASGVDLTGVWHGLYTYSRSQESVSFVATLIETHSYISGSIHEPKTAGDPPYGTMYATLLGTRHGSAVAFLKTYDTLDPIYRPPIAYEGTLSGDETEIEGRWNIQNIWFGTFL